MSQKELAELIRTIAVSQGIDPNLALAIAGHESNYDPTACRFEPKWKWFVNPSKFAKQLLISEITEKMLQACSWGPMQVMGAVARELGFTGQITTLVYPEIGVLFGCKKLKSLINKYANETDVISAYNQGAPLKTNNVYNNSSYVNNVMERLNTLRSKTP
jgi:soluble lytic murein transglycosylase-like protein